MFPGVGAFQQCMGTLECKRLIQPLKEYIQAGSCFLRLLVDTHGKSPAQSLDALHPNSAVTSLQHHTLIVTPNHVTLLVRLCRECTIMIDGAYAG